MDRGTVRAIKCLNTQQHKKITQPGLKPRPVSTTPMIRPLPFFYHQAIAVGNIILSFTQHQVALSNVWCI